MSHKVVRTEHRNPLDWAVTRLGITRKAFGEEYGFSKPYLIRVSQGRQSGLSSNLLAEISKAFEKKGLSLTDLCAEEFGVEDLDEAYDLWVIRHRKVQTLPNPVKDQSVSPFMRLVKAAGGVARMSALLGVNDYLVERYAKGVTYKMPMPILAALTDMGYEHTEVLMTAMEKWGEKK